MSSAPGFAESPRGSSPLLDKSSWLCPKLKAGSSTEPAVGAFHRKRVRASKCPWVRQALQLGRRHLLKWRLFFKGE